MNGVDETFDVTNNYAQREQGNNSGEVSEGIASTSWMSSCSSAPKSINSRNGYENKRSLSPFENDAFEKAAENTARKYNGNNNHRDNNDNHDQNVKLIKVLEDFLLSSRLSEGEQSKQKRRRLTGDDPLSTLFKPFIEEGVGRKPEVVTVSLVPLVPAATKKRKRNEVFTPSPTKQVKSRVRKKSETFSTVKTSVSSSTKKNNLLVNGHAFTSKGKLPLNGAIVANGARGKKMLPQTTKKNNASQSKRKIEVTRATKATTATITGKSKQDISKAKTKTNSGLKLKLNIGLAKRKVLDAAVKIKPIVRKNNVEKPKTMIQEKKKKVKKKLQTTTKNEVTVDPPNDRIAIKEVQPPNKIEKVCQKCLKSDENLVRCCGNCRGMFHATCTSTNTDESCSIKCDECTTGRHSCFACKSNVGDVKQCSIRPCGKFYHIAPCLSSFKAVSFDSKGAFTCPLHYCISCMLSCDKKTARQRSRMYRCVRCPVAYHGTEACFPAGSVILSPGVLLCPAHQEIKKGRNGPINVNWCFVCSHGGSLICCETCPASFHAECLQIEPPEGSYYCADCHSKNHAKYGDILWVKLGNYRWWPAKVCNPKNVPLNIQNVHHELGDFPVRFFGTHDYYWTRRSRTFQFLEGDHVANTGSSNKLSQIFKTAMEEALIAYQKWKNVKETREAYNHEKKNLKPPPYKYLKANKPVGKVSAVFVPDPSQMTSCDCDPKADNPCGPNSECLNRLLMLECNPDTCPAGDGCQNQQFVKQEYVKSEIIKTDGKGWGLKSLENIFKGQFVNEYVGEIIDENECQRRIKKMQEENDTAYYFLTLDKDRVIDAGKKGNLSRFMNHSCQPNCELRKWTVNGDTRVGLFALCDIPTGTELTFNYNLECLGNEKTKCRCEAPNCSGFIGERPKSLNAGASNKKSQRSTSKTRRRKAKTRPRAISIAKYDSECFRCGFDGELLLCDRRMCTKAFHLKCLNLEKTPHGRWECPWHHCDTCGKIANFMCSVCPNSFCTEHSTNNVMTLSDGTIFCMDHNSDTEV